MGAPKSTPPRRVVLLQENLSCVARDGCGEQGEGSLWGKGGAACLASQGLGCQWSAAQMCSRVRVQGHHLGQLLFWGDLHRSRESIPQNRPSPSRGQPWSSSHPSAAAKPECPGWLQQSSGHLGARAGLPLSQDTCSPSGHRVQPHALTWGLSIRPSCSSCKGQLGLPGHPSRTAGVEAPIP